MSCNSFVFLCFSFRPDCRRIDIQRRVGPIYNPETATCASYPAKFPLAETFCCVGLEASLRHVFSLETVLNRMDCDCCFCLSSPLTVKLPAVPVHQGSPQQMRYQVCDLCDLCYLSPRRVSDLIVSPAVPRHVRTCTCPRST